MFDISVDLEEVFGIFWELIQELHRSKGLKRMDSLTVLDEDDTYAFFS